MKILVGYNGSKAANSALDLAKKHAKVFNAKIYILTSMEGGGKESVQQIRKAEEALDTAKKKIEKDDIACEVHQMVRGLSPGEDIIQFAKDNNIDHIFTGVEKKSKTQKLILGSTAQYIILKARCPVTTTK